MSNSLKPLYIYTDNDSLYVKNFNENPQKLSSNIKLYSANLDGNNKFNICSIDNSGRILHFFNNKGSWKKNTIGKFFINSKNIKDMRLYITNSYFNIFVIEKNPISENLYRVTHFNFNPSNYKVVKSSFNSVFKDDEYIYKINIDDLSNIIFSYKTKDLIKRSFNTKTTIFNNTTRKWMTFNTIPTFNNLEFEESSSPQDIKSDIFEFLYSIKYKL